MNTTTEIAIDEQLDFAGAVLSVLRLRYDLGTHLFTAQRELEAKSQASMTSIELDLALSCIGSQPQGPTDDAPLIELLRATLYAWNKVPTDLRQIIFKELSDRAVIRGEDPFIAMLIVENIIAGARGLADITAEQQAKVKAKAAENELMRVKRSNQAVIEKKRYATQLGL